MKKLNIKIEFPIFYDDDGYYLDDNYRDFPDEISDIVENQIIKQIDKDDTVCYQIPNTISAGILIAWKNEYNVLINLDHGCIKIRTNNHKLKKEIINYGGTVAE